MDFSIFKNKYRISGNLEVLTALHIGSGVEENGMDAPFITVDGNSKNKNFYIPGSSFRGYLSTKLERLLAKENGFKFVDKETKEELNEADVKLIFGYTNLQKEDSSVKERVLKKIYRETGATETGAKFDYNVIPLGAYFKFEMELDNVEGYQLDLIKLALKDILEEDLFGGKLSRGIGKCKLNIEKIEFVDKTNIQDYLFKKSMKTKDVKEFLEITNLELK